MYTIYTDGSYQSSLNAGGYSTIIIKDGKIIKRLYKGYKNTTNNRMELRGVLEALQYFKTPTKMKIYSDSQYVISSIVNGHAKKWFEQQDFSKKNLDLWHDIIDLVEFHNVEFQWVKGHSDNEYNELCDKLAVHAAQCLNLPEDNEYTNRI